MAATEVSICNRALARIGIKNVVVDLDEDTPEATACNVQYAECRDVVLASFPWRFATKRQELVAIEDGERDGWAYGYTLPSDFLSMIHVWSGARNPTPDKRIEFALELNDAGTKLMLLTDEVDASISYVAKVTAAATFPPLFRDALSWLIASELAMPMAVKEALGTNAMKKYLLALSAAQAAEHHESYEREPDSVIITSRL
jgi:hypothetical protein